VCLGLAVLLLISPLLPMFNKQRKQLATEES
jgi:hypothetical protein